MESSAIRFAGIEFRVRISRGRGAMAAIEEGRDCAAGGYRDNQKSKRVWTANYLHFSIDEPEKPCFSASKSCKAQSGRLKLIPIVILALVLLLASRHWV